MPQKVLFLVSYLSPDGLSFIHLSTGAPEHRLIIHGFIPNKMEFNGC